MADDRGALTRKFVDLANEIRPDFTVLENVKGLLNDQGNAFGCYLAALCGNEHEVWAGTRQWPAFGYHSGPDRHVAWRVLDAQYSGLAQRRERLFVVACPRNGPDPREVLFERDCEAGNFKPANEVGSHPSAAAGAGCAPVWLNADTTPKWNERIAYTLRASGGSGGRSLVCEDGRIRELTPRERERLMGWPDDYSLIEWPKGGERTLDILRNKAIGNSLAVPDVRWLGERIKEVRAAYRRDIAANDLTPQWTPAEQARRNPARAAHRTPNVTATAPSVQLHLGDCLNYLKALADASVDLIAIDPPYETTNWGWDKLIPFDLLWPELRRVLTPTGTVVLTAAQPFTSMAVMSAPDLFKFSMVWKKSRPTGHLLAKCRPRMEHEDVLIFSKGVTVHAARTARPMTYHPQGLVTLDKPIRSRNGRQSSIYTNSGKPGPCNGRGYQTFNGKRIGHKDDVRVQSKGRYPTSILEFESERGTGHPTQKPMALFEYLIRTFSNPGDVVCDLTMGSGTTGVAAVNSGRSFIGVELDPDFFAIAAARVAGEPFAHLVEIMHANAAAREKAVQETKAHSRAAKKAAREAMKSKREGRKSAKATSKVVTLARTCRSAPDREFVKIKRFAA